MTARRDQIDQENPRGELAHSSAGVLQSALEDFASRSCRPSFWVLATGDIGTGTYTIMTQIAADTLGLPLERVAFNLGDSSLPKAPVEGGSLTALTVGSVVKVVCEKLKMKLFSLACEMCNSPLARLKLQDVIFADGNIYSQADHAQAVSFRDATRQAGTTGGGGLR